MSISRKTRALAVTVLLAAFGSVANAADISGVAAAVRRESSNMANIPLVIFILAAIVVYLGNRPRVAVYARSRRNRRSARHH